jgi:hypothetical protein
MHLYLLIIATVCLQKTSSADLHQSLAACNPLHFASATAALHVSLLYTAAALEIIVPAVDAMMPDKTPLVVGAWTGCNALALRISYGRTRSVLGEQVSA